jgi:hypothetical protein
MRVKRGAASAVKTPQIKPAPPIDLIRFTSTVPQLQEGWRRTEFCCSCTFVVCSESLHSLSNATLYSRE